MPQRTAPAPPPTHRAPGPPQQSYFPQQPPQQQQQQQQYPAQYAYHDPEAFHATRPAPPVPPTGTMRKASNAGHTFHPATRNQSPGPPMRKDSSAALQQQYSAEATASLLRHQSAGSAYNAAMEPITAGATSLSSSGVVTAVPSTSAAFAASSSGNSTPSYPGDPTGTSRSFKHVFNSMVSSFSDMLGSDKKLSISLPYNPVHITHVGFNQDNGEFVVCLFCLFIFLDDVHACV